MTGLPVLLAWQLAELSLGCNLFAEGEFIWPSWNCLCDCSWSDIL